MGEAVPGDVVSIRIDNPDSLETVVPMSSDLGVTHLGTLTEGRSWRVLLQKNE
jgi:TusA-related sulfurtransferase|tara:strand:+ start:388 stop:546 length:159 start_codon:yes stop_codon:yes gene_type:complete